MLNARAALGQAYKRGAINITAGTKGGRGQSGGSLGPGHALHHAGT